MSQKCILTMLVHSDKFSHVCITKTDTKTSKKAYFLFKKSTGTSQYVIYATNKNNPRYTEGLSVTRMQYSDV